MDNESIANLMRKWLASSGDVLSVDELLERIEGREQWIANEIGWRDKLNYQQLEMFQKAEADNAALRRQLEECQAQRDELRSAFRLASDNPDIPECYREAMRDTLERTRA